MAEFAYSPARRKKTYRVIVDWKDLQIVRGQLRLFDDTKCFFYITNDWKTPADELVFKANGRSNQENHIQEFKSGVLTAPLDRLESNWTHMVMALLAWNLKSWAALMLPA